MTPNKIPAAFRSGKAFVAFVTGGDPNLDTTERLIVEMAASGADLIEIGIPFSDPVAEGPVISAANVRALSSGTTTEKLFESVARVRKKVSVPLVFLTYLNPILGYGKEKFFARCRATGIDGVIVPDLPYEEQGEIKSDANKNGVSVISLVAPTSEERVRTIAAASEGFLYVVSSMGVTGVRSEIKTDLPAIIALAKSATSTPVCVGFGVHTPEQAKSIAKYADGVIVGSAIVKLVAEHGENSAERVGEYVREMKAAIR